MTASFAGSRSLDERRRRRLATESDDPTFDNDLPVSAEPPAPETDDDVWPQSAAVHFPLRGVISQSLWKHWAVAFLCLAFGTGLLYCGYRVAELSEKLGPGFARLFNLSNGPVFRCYRSMLMILAGQLALLIYWARSRSLQDYAGRYRFWVWIAGAWFGFAFCTASGAHHAWSESVLWAWDVPLKHRETLCWLVPAVAVGGMLLWLLQRDMRGCRSSLSMLWLAAGLLLAAGVQTLPIEVTWHALIQPALAIGGVVCLFTSMLFHTRHVVYQSAEPPPLRSFRLPIRLPRIQLPKWRLRSRKRAQAPPTAKTKDTKPSPPATKTKTRVKSKPRAPKVTASAPAMDEQTVQKTSKSNRKLAEPAGSTRDIRFDEPPDAELLKGLSKRERRRLRKQWREQQRAVKT